MRGFYNGWTLFAMLLPLLLLPYTLSTKTKTQVVLFTAFLSCLWMPQGYFVRPPLFPTLHKLTFPWFGLLPVVFFGCQAQIRRAKFFTIYELIVAVGFAGSLGTALTNPDPLIWGTWIVNEIPGLNLKDGFFDALYQLLLTWAPFLIGRWLFRDPEHLKDVLRALVLFAVGYIPPILIELRIAPVLHERVYGLALLGDFAHGAIRWGGYRPQVFTESGIGLAIFIWAAAGSALLMTLRHPVELWKIPMKTLWRALAVILVLCKSTGAIMWGLMFYPLMMMFKPKQWVRAAVLCSALVLVYPLLRGTNLFPVNAVMAFAESLGEERAVSLGFRFQMEGILLERANQRLYFGWGAYGRSSIYHHEIGTKEMTIADGAWIIAFVKSGLVGFLVNFGLLTVPVFFAALAYRKLPDSTSKDLLAGYALIVAVLGVELLPNGLFSNYIYLLAGALAGLSQQALADPKGWARDELGPPHPYAHFPGYPAGVQPRSPGPRSGPGT